MVIGGCGYFLWMWLLLVYVWQLLEEWLLVGGVIGSGCGYFLWVWLLLVYVWQLIEEWLLVGVGVIIDGTCVVWLLLMGVVIDGGCCECRCMGILLVCLDIAGRSGSCLWES